MLSAMRKPSSSDNDWMGWLVGWLVGFGKIMILSLYRDKRNTAISAPRKMGIGYLICYKKYLWLLF